MAGIYIHIPFCKQACHYCDFHFSTNQKQKDEVVGAISKELSLQSDFFDNEEIINTIYFGGGTPSLLNAHQIDSLLNTIFKEYKVTPSPEITLEANPDDLLQEKLESFPSLGINRLSIGIQSFDDDILNFLNRAHSAQEAKYCVGYAEKVGIENISVDLIYAIPGMSLKAWKKNLRKAVDLGIKHISSYCLTIEPNTAFGNWQNKGKLKAVEDDLAAEQFEAMVSELENAGFEQYEVSNFCKPGYESKHNSGYWRQQHYLGVGPSAHSYNGEVRQYNISNNAKYLRSLKTGNIPMEVDSLSTKDKINDYLLTTLRTKWGTDLNEITKQYNYNLFREQKLYINSLIENGNATLNGSKLFLTKKGLLLADKITADLFVI